MNKQEQIKKFWESSCKDYDKHLNTTSHYKAQEKILILLLDEIEEPILDLACGTGFLMKLLSKKFSKIYGNDFSLQMTESARKKCDFPITNNNAETLKAYNKKFNTVISCNLFFYLQNRKKAITRWTKLLDNAGKIIFIEEYPFVKPKSQQMNERAEELMALIDPVSPKEIKKIMIQNKFSLAKEVKTKIDNEHDLYGLVFSLR